MFILSIPLSPLDLFTIFPSNPEESSAQLSNQFSQSESNKDLDFQSQASNPFDLWLEEAILSMSTVLGIFGAAMSITGIFISQAEPGQKPKHFALINLGIIAVGFILYNFIKLLYETGTFEAAQHNTFRLTQGTYAGLLSGLMITTCVILFLSLYTIGGIVETLELSIVLVNLFLLVVGTAEGAEELSLKILENVEFGLAIGVVGLGAASIRRIPEQKTRLHTTLAFFMTSLMILSCFYVLFFDIYNNLPYY
ncbi:MAG: hypothetical protein ACTSR8_06985 [Promethearchaeota archaeon]